MKNESSIQSMSINDLEIGKRHFKRMINYYRENAKEFYESYMENEMKGIEISFVIIDLKKILSEKPSPKKIDMKVRKTYLYNHESNEIISIKKMTELKKILLQYGKEEKQFKENVKIFKYKYDFLDNLKYIYEEKFLEISYELESRFFNKAEFKNLANRLSPKTTEVELEALKNGTYQQSFQEIYRPIQYIDSKYFMDYDEKNINEIFIKAKDWDNLQMKSLTLYSLLKQKFPGKKDISKDGTGIINIIAEKLGKTVENIKNAVNTGKKAPSIVKFVDNYMKKNLVSEK